MRDILTAEDHLFLGAVVKISALPSGAGAMDVSTEHGSGFILFNGLIITNKHPEFPKIQEHTRRVF